jgi:hypothetical protein
MQLNINGTLEVACLPEISENSGTIEIFVYIFELLDDPDDALHLARCCTRIYRTFNPSNTRLRIFRSVIIRLHHH